MDHLVPKLLFKLFFIYAAVKASSFFVLGVFDDLVGYFLGFFAADGDDILFDILIFALVYDFFQLAFVLDS